MFLRHRISSNPLTEARDSSLKESRRGGAGAIDTRGASGVFAPAVEDPADGRCDHPSRRLGRTPAAVRRGGEALRADVPRLPRGQATLLASRCRTAGMPPDSGACDVPRRPIDRR